MADLSGLHPFVQDALRTGRIPDNETLASALGKGPEEIARIRDLVERKTTEAEDAEPEHPDAQRFSDRYHQLVAGMTAAWYDEHPGDFRGIPAEERERIEDHCNRQIQGEWTRHLKQLDVACHEDGASVT